MSEQRRFVRRSNQALTQPARSAAVASGRPKLLARLAGVIRDVRDPGDVPLPHLYRGRDFKPARDARAA